MEHASKQNDLSEKKKTTAAEHASVYLMTSVHVINIWMLELAKKDIRGVLKGKNAILQSSIRNATANIFCPNCIKMEEKHDDYYIITTGFIKEKRNNVTFYMILI